MKYYIILLSAIIIFFDNGCDQVINGTDLPYSEKLVVRGVIRDGDIIDSLYIGRTLPYEESKISYWDPNQSKYVEPDLNSYVKDAAVKIFVDGQEYTMQYFKSGYYKNDTLKGVTGKTYRLHVEWKGKTADAVTVIPDVPMFDSVTVSLNDVVVSEYGTDKEYLCAGYARTSMNKVLSLMMEHQQTVSGTYPTPYSYTYGYSFGQVVIKRTEPNIAVADILSKKFELFENGNAQPTDRKLVFTLTSYDEPYYGYFLTSNGSVGETNFSIEPRPIAWNVNGDGIGIFIGASKSVVKTVKLQ